MIVGDSINRTIKVLIIIPLVALTLFGSAFAEPNPHRSLDEAMEEVSACASRRNMVLLPASLLLLGREQEFQTGQVMILSLALATGASSGLKNLINRKRPTPPTTRRNSSFPSGHATAAFAAAAVVASAYPRLAVPAYLAAGTVAYSRLYLRRHYPTDVLAGAAVGMIVSRLVWRYRDRFTIKGRGLIGAWTDGHGPRMVVVVGF